MTFFPDPVDMSVWGQLFMMVRVFSLVFRELVFVISLFPFEFAYLVRKN
jgi:hypothetical protein